jgi:hypothetical protein
MSNRYLRQYDGYLKQHLGLIEDMHQAGADNITIAVRLYDLGSRAQGSVYGQPLEDDRQVQNLAVMVAYIRRKWFKKPRKKPGRKPGKRPAPLHFWADP